MLNTLNCKKDEEKVNISFMSRPTCKAGCLGIVWIQLFLYVPNRTACESNLNYRYFPRFQVFKEALSCRILE